MHARERKISWETNEAPDAECVEGEEYGDGVSLPIRLGVLGSVVSSPTGSGAELRRAQNEFGAFWRLYAAGEKIQEIL